MPTKNLKKLETFSFFSFHFQCRNLTFVNKFFFNRATPKYLINHKWKQKWNAIVKIASSELSGIKNFENSIVEDMTIEVISQVCLQGHNNGV